MLAIIQAETREHIDTARELMTEYANSLGFELCFQSFEEEMRTLPGKYSPPSGRILLAFWEQRAAGVVALRAMQEPGLCEMKRLYVRPDFRGRSLGRILAEAVIAEAAALGYQRMRLDTISGRMVQAIALYRRLGFVQVAAYYPTPVKETLFMELALDRAGSIA